MTNPSSRAAEVAAYHQQSMRRVADTPPPEGQKFAPGQRVRIADDLGRSMRHFPSGVNGTVHHTYAHAYGRGDTKSYCIDIDGLGQVSWYREDQLSAIAPSQTHATIEAQAKL